MVPRGPGSVHPPKRGAAEGWRRAGLLVAALALAGCDGWREVRLEDAGLVVPMPCRPGRFEHVLRLAGESVRWTLLSCDVDGVTYGVASGTVADVRDVAPALAELQARSRAALRGSGATTQPYGPPGATPFPGSVRVRFAGQRPDGSAVEASLRLFARGTRVFELTAIGADLPPAALAPFEDDVRIETRSNGSL